MAGPKHINRRRKREDADDEWAHITSGVGEKIESGDLMDIQDRSITFRNEVGVPSTNYEMYEEEKDKMQDEVGNTAQYLKFVNESIRAKKEKLDQIHERQKKLNDDIAMLQGSPKSKEELDQIKYKDIKVSDVEQTLAILEQQRNDSKKKMDHFSKQVSNSQLELLEKDKQIANIKAELDLMKKNEQAQHKEPKRESEQDIISALKNKLDQVENQKEKDEILELLKTLVSKLNYGVSKETADSLKDNYIK